MNKKNDESLLSSNRVQVRLINPNYPYYGFIVGRDSDFIYLDTSEKEKVNYGVVAIPFFNIMLIVEEKKELMKQ